MPNVRLIQQIKTYHDPSLRSIFVGGDEGPKRRVVELSPSSKIYVRTIGQETDNEATLQSPIMKIEARYNSFDTSHPP